MVSIFRLQSLAVANAAYNSLWYNENKNVKAMLQIMIIRTQRPLTMTIGPFSPMTTDTIVTVSSAFCVWKFITF